MPLNPNILFGLQQVDLGAPIKGSQQGQAFMDEQRQRPIRNELLQGQVQDVRVAQQAREAKILTGVADTLLGVEDIQQRVAVANKIQPNLQSLGINLDGLDAEGLSNSQLNKLKASQAPLLQQAQAATAAEREFQRLTQGLTPQETERARRIELGLEPRAIGSAAQTIAGEGTTEEVAKSQAEIESRKSRAKTVATKGAARGQEAIDFAFETGAGLPTLNRASQLLDEVSTGGFTAEARLKAKQLFGIESADEGELSNLLGKAVLGQLKSTFGAAFTVQEVQRLENIEGGFGKNTETNKRLLNNAKEVADRAVKRGIREAERAGQTNDANDLKAMLNTVAPDASGSIPDGTVIRNPTTGERLIRRGNQWQKI